ncbi:MAG: hypothetical protein ABEJ89_08400 [Haloarculaceae archaeon]
MSDDDAAGDARGVGGAEGAGGAGGNGEAGDAGTAGRSERGRLTRLDAWLAALRADDARRRGALVVALALGLGLAWLHWIGLIVAGALVGLTRRSLPRALLAGLGVGVLSLAALIALTPGLAPAELLALAPASYVTVAAAVLAPMWGALARGVA